jgi:SAM-dependent methyltransferase
MHQEVKEFCLRIKNKYPEYFRGKEVLDCGSLDINGNNRYLFENCNYTGIDIIEGRNVDQVTYVHNFQSIGKKYDVVISTEMLEHDCFFVRSIQSMFNMLKSGGLILITAAGSGKPEHGTFEHNPSDSPLTHNYYKNLSAMDFVRILDMDMFSSFEISYEKTDVRFVGIKR